MNDANVSFCQYLLKGARTEAKKAGVTVPKRITAMRCDRKQFFIEADGITGEYFEGDNAYDAKAKFIYALIDRAQKRDRE